MKNSTRIADIVWIATARLHREQPNVAGFTVGAIIEMAACLGLTGDKCPFSKLKTHAYTHCVANRPANPVGLRMLFETRDQLRRLYRHGDPYHLSRARGKITPQPHQIPSEFRELVEWYFDNYARRPRNEDQDPILLLKGRGGGIWGKETLDACLKRDLDHLR